jgi:hypothetical protein
VGICGDAGFTWAVRYGGPPRGCTLGALRPQGASTLGVDAPPARPRWSTQAHRQQYMFEPRTRKSTVSSST